MQVEQNLQETKVKEYINKYIKELQRHFEVPDKKMRLLLLEVYKDLKPEGFIKIFKSMVKSFYDKKIKGKTNAD